jgi:aryl-alcohol dehydrogenase-like predicted oxidoreductase
LRIGAEEELMDTRNLGRSGLKVSVVGLGCNNFGMRCDLEASRAVIDTALGQGITLLDTADVYGAGKSEEIIGEVLGARRKDVVLATKFAMTGFNAPVRGDRRYVIEACEASLKRLKTDWIDLYQIHRPDPSTPIEETVRALDDLVRAGKVRYLGVSNFAGWQIADAQWTAKSLGLNGFISHQDEYSLVVRDIEKEVLPAAKAHGLGLLPFFPLASGLLTGKYRQGAAAPEGTRLANAFMGARYLTEGNFEVVERLEPWAHERGRSLLDLAFAWLLTTPELGSVIAGATAPGQVEANVAAASWTLTADEAQQVRALFSPPAPVAAAA